MDRAWSKAGICCSHATGDLVVHVPAAIGQRDHPHAGRDQPSRHQHALPRRIAAVLIAQLPIFLSMSNASRAA